MNPLTASALVLKAPRTRVPLADGAQTLHIVLAAAQSAVERREISL
jgi:hypothetical protein